MIGDQDDLATRLRGRLPRTWFGLDAAAAAVVGALLAAGAWALSLVFDQIAFARLQTRLATATGGWLELAANDFLGPYFRRIAGEADPAYSSRIRKEIVRHRNTRTAVDEAVFDLTGNHPDIYEPWRPADCGGWGTPGLAYGLAGRYGSRGAPRTAIVTTPYPMGYGIPNRGGWGIPVGGWGMGNFSWVNDLDITGSGATTTDIIAAVERVRPITTTIYVQFSGLDGLPPINAPRPYETEDT